MVFFDNDNSNFAEGASFKDEELNKEMLENMHKRDEICDSIQDCHDKIDSRNESVKSIIQYSLIYLGFVSINVLLSVLGLSSATAIIIPALTIVYAGVIAKDASVVKKYKTSEIYSLLNEYNKELSNIDNQYKNYSNKFIKEKNTNNKTLNFDEIKDDFTEKMTNEALVFDDDIKSKQKVKK